jgi:hypothetical protein
MTSERKANVWAALKTAQESLDAVGKGSKNQFHGYNYTSAEDMLKACRKALHDAGLVAYRRSWSIQQTDLGCMVVNDFCVTLANKVTPPQDNSISAEVTYPAIPGNGRPLDKAVSAALTTAFSYWLRDILMLPRVDGLEVDTRDDSTYKHDEQEAIGLAVEIEDRATDEQMQKLLDALPKYKASKLEEVPVVTLKAWLKRVKETA